jgi:hypothetical protein
MNSRRDLRRDGEQPKSSKKVESSGYLGSEGGLSVEERTILVLFQTETLDLSRYTANLTRSWYYLSKTPGPCNPMTYIIPYGKGQCYLADAVH